MEEKNVTKISLSTFFLILAIIAIIVMGVFIYKLNNDKTAEVQKSTELQAQVSSLNSTVNSLQSKINTISETVNNDISLTPDKAIELAQSTLNKFIELERYENSNIGPMPGILIELGLETSEQIDNETNGINDPSTYIKSKTKYSDFKLEMLKYMTEKYFNENYSQYKNIDSYVAFCNCAGGIIPISFQNLKFIKNDNLSYQFTVIVRDEEMYAHYLAGESINSTEYEFKYNIIFEYVNENMLISSINPA